MAHDKSISGQTNCTLLLKLLNAFITSTSWLDVKFGQAMEKFLLKKCQINNIIYFDKNVFEDALANTCITILTKKKPDEEDFVKFIRIKKMMDIRELIKIIKGTNKDYEDKNIKILLVKQKELIDEEKWSRFIRAPPVYHILKKNPLLVPLSNKEKIAEVIYPYKSTANDFFILGKDKIKFLKAKKIIQGAVNYGY